MPGSTPTYGLTYQELGDAPNGAGVGENLAEDVEAELVRIDSDVADRPLSVNVDAALALRLQTVTSNLKLQRGTVVVTINSGTNQGFTDVAFPAAFATTPIVLPGPNSLGATNAVLAIAADASTAGFRMYARTGGSDNNGANANYTMAWFAIGT